MCYHVRFITRSVTSVVTMRWVMAWLGNGFGCSMKDERTCTMKREVGVHLWWMMIWCVRSTKDCLTTDVSQFLICPCTFLRFQGLYDIVSSHLCYRKVCARWVPKMLTEEHKKTAYCLCFEISDENKWTTPRTALIWRQVIITSSYT